MFILQSVLYPVSPCKGKPTKLGSIGVHIGQTDCPLPLARQLVGDNAIIGVSVGTPEEARRAVAEGADYVGIGAVWPTTSKDVTAKIKLGPQGVSTILDELDGEYLSTACLIFRWNSPIQCCSSPTRLGFTHVKGFLGRPRCDLGYCGIFYAEE
jgi:hypothetical protein